MVKENRLDVSRRGACCAEGQQLAPDLRSIDRSIGLHLDTQRGSLLRSHSRSDEGRSTHPWVLVEYALTRDAEERF